MIIIRCVTMAIANMKTHMPILPLIFTNQEIIKKNIKVMEQIGIAQFSILISVLCILGCKRYVIREKNFIFYTD
jgi:hypothetical protein